MMSSSTTRRGLEPCSPRSRTLSDGEASWNVGVCPLSAYVSDHVTPFDRLVRSYEYYSAVLCDEYLPHPGQ